MSFSRTAAVMAGPPRARTMRPRLPMVLAALALLSACAGPRAPTTVPSELPEIRPGSGVVIGYLPREQMPDSLALLPAPPAPGTPALAADQAAFEQAQSLRGSPRWQFAALDNELAFPKAAQTLSCALGLPIGEATTPHVNILLRRTLADAGLSTYRAKDHYKRTRPFVQNGVGTCAPHEEKKLSTDGSYPSGHAALGWAWALVLAELVPERADALLARGHAFGQSRVVCNVHWQSDVDAGRVMGAASVARLHADPGFRAQLDAARIEVDQARRAGLKPSGDCALEANTLKAR
jgi:acid phosphatase (class A)